MDTISFPTLTEADRFLPVYTTTVGHWDNQERIDRPEGFPDYQWLQVTSGEGELFIGSERYTVKAGQAFCLFPHVPNKYYAIREPWDVHYLSFNGSLAEPLLRQAGIMQSGVFSTDEQESVVSQIGSIYNLTQSGQASLGLECSKLVYALLLDLMKVVLTGSHSSERSLAKLSPVMHYIESHIAGVITIADMAKCIDVTPQYLCLLFKKTMHMRPMEYVNRQRINRSKEIMFRESGMKTGDIAATVGFDSASYFSSVFRKIEGLSPEQFRKLYGIR
ncbi:AraC family transcriptional regulator [Paenibacillus radicis (ex Gao et al. 2016)]|uniref:HTH araC/xylS-type domain-containing protein n=1 Tax=Paenibacillus radicis (ex Gao et al. 2016) TaxID=1737354 RepID=A0A917GN96_9BACL|nr:AraC family transcriptional regulator [Paenibacillus radicis (ex Gao et al. 2016)]GGG52478.1 hypothetical protein GCM10010918_01480 [Paenibacillus radicis (ex Gao et al. 2016)]